VSKARPIGSIQLSADPRSEPTMPLKVLPSKLCTPCAPRVFLTQKGGYQQCCHAGTPFRKKTSRFGFERSGARQVEGKIAHAGRQCKCASDSPGGRAGTAPRSQHRWWGSRPMRRFTRSAIQ
jgi:hypothetical protein